MFVRIIKNGEARGSIEITERAINAVGMGVFFRRFAYDWDGVQEKGDIVGIAKPSESMWRENAREVNELAKQLGVELEESP